MHHIVFLDRATLAPGIHLRRPAFEHHWTEYERTEPSQVVERLTAATMAVSYTHLQVLANQIKP